MITPSELKLDHLNSATKYPSIPTYHVLKGRGNLTEERSLTFGSDDLVVTEKIDGANGRIIYFAQAHDYLIGSREELLYARGDRIENPADGIVEALRPIAEHMDVVARSRPPEEVEDAVLVLWAEAYGGKQYRADKSVAARVFDAAVFHADALRALCARERASIAAWRDQGNQPFFTERGLELMAERFVFQLAPRLRGLSAPPAGVAETHEWLKSALPAGSLVSQGGTGQAEGVIVRTADRRRIAKLRFEDYERAQRARPQACR